MMEERYIDTEMHSFIIYGLSYTTINLPGVNIIKSNPGLNSLFILIAVSLSATIRPNE